ncbi:hypothetical protein LJB89_04730 [Tyzzerella sp. OttesenSCG-928-J15]|nr:hypothetical protein [Tyzzerella sp. OttesenSCG-928-J15]
MSLRPIDFQVVSRSTETSKITNNPNNRQDMQQQVFAKELDKRVEVELTQVIQANKSEFNKVNDEGRNKNSQDKRKKKDEKKKEAEQGAVKYNKNSTSMYDISI